MSSQPSSVTSTVCSNCAESERSPRGLRLSPVGEVFLTHARAIQAQADAASTALRALGGE